MSEGGWALRDVAKAVPAILAVLAALGWGEYRTTDATHAGQQQALDIAQVLEIGMAGHQAATAQAVARAEACEAQLAGAQ